MEKPDEALRYFRLMQSRFPGSSRLTESIRGEAQAWLKLGKPVEALAALQNPKLEETAESLDLRARCHEEAGERTEAANLYLRLYCDFVTSKQSSPALQRLQAIAPKSAGPGSNYSIFLRRAENLLRPAKNAEARDVLLMLGKTKAPGPESYQKRALLLAQTEYNLGKAEPALKYLKVVTKADSSMHAQALYLKGSGISQEREYSDETARAIDSETRAIIDKIYDRVRGLITDRKPVLMVAAAELKAKETLEGDRLRQLLAGDLVEEKR